MTIKHDRASSSILTKCSRCGDYWWAFSFSMERARTVAEQHEVAVHDVDPDVAAGPRRAAEYRARGSSAARL